MEDKILNKDKSLCILSTIIIVAAYGIERIIEVSITPSKTVGLILAMIYTILFAVVLFCISKSSNSFFGILASLIGYKMMPPPIGFLESATADGDMLYYIVGRAAAAFFVILAYRFYKMQEEPHEIRLLPLLAVLIVIPFFNDISLELSKYLMLRTGSMLYCYFAQFICYAAATLIILGVAFKSGYGSMRFTAYFEYAALGINILRQLGKIGYFAINAQHISKSYYVWIALYILLIICFAAAKSKAKNQFDS